jgi:ELMO/CED-12 family
MNSHTVEDLTSCVLDFQGNMARVIYRKKTTLVEPDVEETHAAAIDYIWTNSRLLVETASDGTQLKWRQLGFASESLSHEFSETGVLGLDCLVSLRSGTKSVIDPLCKRNILYRVTPTSFQKLYRSKTPDPYSGGVRSHARQTRSLSFYRSTGVS